MTAAAIICFGLACVALILSVRHFRQKGFLLNNAYIYASPEEREKLDKRPWYRQTAVCLLMVSLIFALIGLYALTRSGMLLILEALAVAAALVYAVVSTVMINKELALKEKEL